MVPVGQEEPRRAGADPSRRTQRDLMWERFDLRYADGDLGVEEKGETDLRYASKVRCSKPPSAAKSKSRPGSTNSKARPRKRDLGFLSTQKLGPGGPLQVSGLWLLVGAVSHGNPSTGLMERMHFRTRLKCDGVWVWALPGAIFVARLYAPSQPQRWRKFWPKPVSCSASLWSGWRARFVPWAGDFASPALTAGYLNKVIVRAFAKSHKAHYVKSSKLGSRYRPAAVRAACGL